MGKSRIVTHVISLFLLLAAATVAVAAPNTITLKVAEPTNFHSGADVIAERYGFFEREGLKFQYVNVPDVPAKQLAALKAGQIDVLAGHPDLFINAVKSGLKVKGVVRGSLGNASYPHLSFFVRKDSTIKSGKDLAGKKVAPGEWKESTFDTSCAGFYWSRFLKENNIARNAVKQVPLPESQHAKALEDGSVDVIISTPAYTDRHLKDAKLRLLRDTWDLYPVATDREDAEIYLRGFTDDFIKKNPEAVRKYVRALVQAQQYANDHRKENFAYFEELQKVAPSITNKLHLSVSGLIEDRPLKLWLAQLEANGTLKPGQIKPGDLYTNAYNPYSEYKANDPKKNPTFYDTLKLDWSKKNKGGVVDKTEEEIRKDELKTNVAPAAPGKKKK
ncbi:MAG: ABC transporter substrate-binding protein [Desulfuromonadaceae bacterium]